MTVGRRVAAGTLVAVAVAAGAFALGAATAPEAPPAGAPAAEGPRGIDVPPLGSVAALPQLREEAPVPATEVESGEGEASVTETPPATEAPPAEAAPESPAPEASPPASSGNEVVPEGL